MPDEATTNLLKTLQRQLGGRWDALSPADRELIAEVAADATGLHLSALSIDPADTAARDALAVEARQIDAQLAGIASVAAAEVRGAFWQAFSAIAQVGLHVGLAAVGVSPGAVGAVADAVGILMQRPTSEPHVVAMAAAGWKPVFDDGEDVAAGGPNLDPPPGPAEP